MHLPHLSWWCLPLSSLSATAPSISSISFHPVTFQEGINSTPNHFLNDVIGKPGSYFGSTYLANLPVSAADSLFFHIDDAPGFSRWPTVVLFYDLHEMFVCTSEQGKVTSLGVCIMSDACILVIRGSDLPQI